MLGVCFGKLVKVNFGHDRTGFINEPYKFVHIDMWIKISAYLHSVYNDTVYASIAEVQGLGPFVT